MARPRTSSPPSGRPSTACPTSAPSLRAANARYLDFLAAIDDPQVGLRQLAKIAEPVREDDRSHRGLNLFHGPDLDLCRAVFRGEFTISGVQARHLRSQLPELSGPQLSRALKRLRLHGLIKKIGHRYKYYLTAAGRTVLATAVKLRELVVIPAFNAPVVAVPA